MANDNDRNLEWLRGCAAELTKRTPDLKFHEHNGRIFYAAENGAEFDPIMFNDQAFILLAQFGLMIWPPRFVAKKMWLARLEDDQGNTISQAKSLFLNEAIVKCIYYIPTRTIEWR